MSYKIITPPTRNDALRLGTLLHRYARGGILYGMAGVKAGLRAPVTRKIITPDFKFELTGDKRIFSKSGRAKPNSSYSHPNIKRTGKESFNLEEGNGRFRKFLERIKPEGNGRLDYVSRIDEILNANTPSELRSAIASARREKNSFNYLTEAIVNGDFSKHQLSLEQMYIRNDAIETYKKVMAEIPENRSVSARQMELITRLADKNLIVENPYCKSGLSYADGTEFRPGNTPIEDFLIGDKAVNFSESSPYNEREIGRLENLRDQDWGWPDVWHG